jgi:hypothetical protein
VWSLQKRSWSVSPYLHRRPRMVARLQSHLVHELLHGFRFSAMLFQSAMVSALAEPSPWIAREEGKNAYSRYKFCVSKSLYSSISQSLGRLAMPSS